MKRTKRFLVLGIVIILSCYMMHGFFSLMHSDLEKTVINCKEYYNDYWKLEYVKEDKSEKNISICFEEKPSSGKEQELSMKETQEAISSALLEHEMWKGYSIQIIFLHVGDYFTITVNNTEKRISACMPIFLERIAELFPDTTHVYLGPAYYNSIEEIKGFTDLKKLEFSQGLTDDEKAYVWSVFPGCSIEE